MRCPSRFIPLLIVVLVLAAGLLPVFAAADLSAPPQPPPGDLLDVPPLRLLGLLGTAAMLALVLAPLCLIALVLLLLILRALRVPVLRVLLLWLRAAGISRLLWQVWMLAALPAGIWALSIARRWFDAAVQPQTLVVFGCALAVITTVLFVRVTGAIFRRAQGQMAVMMQAGMFPRR